MICDSPLASILKLQTESTSYTKQNWTHVWPVGQDGVYTDLNEFAIQTLFTTPCNKLASLCMRAGPLIKARGVVFIRCSSENRAADSAHAPLHICASANMSGASLICQAEQCTRTHFQLYILVHGREYLCVGWPALFAQRGLVTHTVWICTLPSSFCCLSRISTLVGGWVGDGVDLYKSSPTQRCNRLVPPTACFCNWWKFSLPPLEASHIFLVWQTN